MLHVDKFALELVTSVVKLFKIFYCSNKTLMRVINFLAYKVIMRCILLTSSGCEQMSDTSSVTGTGLTLECGHYKYFTAGSYSVHHLYN